MIIIISVDNGWFILLDTKTIGRGKTVATIDKTNIHLWICVALWTIHVFCHLEQLYIDVCLAIQQDFGSWQTPYLHS